MKTLIDVYRNQDISFAELTHCLDLNKALNIYIYICSIMHIIYIYI